MCFPKDTNKKQVANFKVEFENIDNLTACSDHLVHFLRFAEMPMYIVFSQVFLLVIVNLRRTKKAFFDNLHFLFFLFFVFFFFWGGGVGRFRLRCLTSPNPSFGLLFCFWLFFFWGGGWFGFWKV